MAEITSDISLEELAAIISQALESAGILATLSGGVAVSIYTNNHWTCSGVATAHCELGHAEPLTEA